MFTILNYTYELLQKRNFLQQIVGESYKKNCQDFFFLLQTEVERY